jgi:hypothetical protein
MPFSISGIPDGYLIYVPKFLVTFKGDAGKEQVWFRGWSSLDKPQPAIVNYQAEAFTTDTSFVSTQLAASQGKALDAQASVDLFLFSPAITKRVRFGDSPVNVGDGFQCYFNLLASSGVFRATRCRAAVGWPNLVRVSMSRGEPAETKTFIDESRMSYSLIPVSSLSLNSTEERTLGWSEPVSPEFTFSVLGPPRHFHREIDLKDVQVTILPAIERRS